MTIEARITFEITLKIKRNVTAAASMIHKKAKIFVGCPKPTSHNFFPVDRVDSQSVTVDESK